MMSQQMDIPGTDGRYFVKVDGTVWRRWKHRSPTMLKGRYRPGDRNVEYKLSCDGSYRVVVASSIMKQIYFAHLPKGVSLRHRNGLATDFAVWNLQLIQSSGWAGSATAALMPDAWSGLIPAPARW